MVEVCVWLVEDFLVLLAFFSGVEVVGFFLTTLSVVSASGVDLGFVDELRCFTSLTALGASVVAVFVVVFFTLGVEAVGLFGPWGQSVHRKGKSGASTYRPQRPAA